MGYRLDRNAVMPDFRRNPRSMAVLSWLASIATLGVAFTSQPLAAQSDSISLVTGRSLRGTVQSSTAESIVVQTSDGTREIQPWNVRRIRFEEPREVTQARTAFMDDRFNASLEFIQNMTELPERELVEQEAEFYRSMSAARVALNGGNVSLQQATEWLLQFVTDHPNNFRVLPAIEALGELYMAQGQFDQALSYFQKASSSQWPEISFQGKLKSGRAQLLLDQLDEAIATFRTIENDTSNAEDYAIQGRLIAQCLRAKALAKKGDTQQARSIAEQIIKNESDKNVVLFAHAYNALGASYEQENKVKPAIRAYLHTDLLFAVDPESHAEALYHLSQLWREDERPDRALRAQQKLKDRYRNSHWASRI